MYTKHLKMLGNKVWLNLEDYEFFATGREDKERYNNVSFFFFSSLAASGSDQLVWSVRLIWYGVMFKDIHTSVNQSGRVSTLH